MKLHFKKLGAGRPVIILHGLFGSSDNWATFGRNLSEQDCQVYLVDQRNHGRSPHSDAFDYALLAADVDELVRSEGLSNAILLGHSMGGKTAMACVAANPGSPAYAGIIVVDIAPGYYAPHHQNVIAALQHANPASATTRKEVEARLREKLNDEGTVQFLAKNLYWEAPEKLGWRFHLDALVQHIETVGSEIIVDPPSELPALFIGGSESKYISESDEDSILKNFPKAVMETAPNAGHWVHADNPKWLLDTVVAFLENLR